uniref:recombinase family protein n=1 Tax=Klebsiella pneumoniae TaxID=573 RepID=UPI001F4AB64D
CLIANFATVPVTELSRWGRSTLDLLNTLRELENWKVSVIAMNGMAFDLSSPYGRMLATFLSGIAEFEPSLTSCNDTELTLRVSFRPQPEPTPAITG